MRTFAGLVLIVGALSVPSLAFAAGNSTPGIDRYLNNSGRQQATEVGAQCDSGAGSGAFGYLGKDTNMGVKSDPGDPGANGQQTGINNSSVCGNRQSN
ncbi:MAG: hypothetical protein Q7T08_12480 [Devosia sp.]|nr:hypothetical protein [Devosia sp.]